MVGAASVSGLHPITSVEIPELLKHLCAYDRLGVDTEGDSLHCYREKLCLIQISTPQRDVLVDPLAGYSLEPLVTLLSTKELVIHGADFDLRMLRRIKIAEPERVFDTLIAARMVGIAECNLAALVQKFFGIVLPKHSQKANWARRPLSHRMIEYAVSDSHHLLALAERLEHELQQLGRFDWFGQSCRRAVSQAMLNRERDLERAWRIHGSSRLNGRSLAVLRALWEWRETEAEQADRPPFHILSNEHLINAAVRFDFGQPVDFHYFSAGRRNRFNVAAERALQLPESEWPKKLRGVRVRRTAGQEQQLKDLKRKRDAAAESLAIEASLIAPRAALEEIIRTPEAVGTLLPWQRELLQI
jgi:ribonuclease D